MASNYTSPYATAFKSAIKRGTSYNSTVASISKRTGKSTDTVWASLYKAGLCFRQKFNGQWIYCPWDAKKTTATNNKTAQFNAWQWFAEWCITSGQCTPEQMWKKTGTQQAFMTWSKKFWGRQFTWTSTTAKKTTGRKTSGRKTSARKTTGRKTTTKWASTSGRKTTAKRSGNSTSYKFRTGSSARKTTRRAA